MRKRKMDIESDIEHCCKSDKHDKTRVNSHGERYTRLQMYVCMHMCCPCTVMYSVHAYTHTYLMRLLSSDCFSSLTLLAPAFPFVYTYCRKFDFSISFGGTTSQVNTNWIFFPLLFEVKCSFCSDRLAVRCCHILQFYPEFDACK